LGHCLTTFAKAPVGFTLKNLENAWSSSATNLPLKERSIEPGHYAAMQLVQEYGRIATPGAETFYQPDSTAIVWKHVTQLHYTYQGHPQGLCKVLILLHVALGM
jgi:hypothetical protein